MRTAHLPADHALPHLESHEEAFCSRVVRREGGLLGRRFERELAAAPIGGGRDHAAHRQSGGLHCAILRGKLSRFHFSVFGGTCWADTSAYPPALLGFALLTYAGVHFLTAGYSGFSEGIVINNGVPAGCAQGNHAARLALYHILQKCHEVHLSSTTAQWVDDLSQRTQSPPSEVVNMAVEAALQLVQDLQEDELAVAAKSVVIAATPSIAKQVVSTLAGHDIHIQGADQRIWVWMCLGQESQCVVPWPRDGPRLGDVREDARHSANGLRDKPVHVCGEWGPGRSKLMGRRLWERRRQGSSRQDREQRKQLNVEGRGRCLTTHSYIPDPAVQIPCNYIRQLLVFWVSNPRIRPKIGEDCTTIATTMMARSPAVRWWYV